MSRFRRISDSTGGPGPPLTTISALDSATDMSTASMAGAVYFARRPPRVEQLRAWQSLAALLVNTLFVLFALIDLNFAHFSPLKAP
jgi:hypothetical protein